MAQPGDRPTSRESITVWSWDVGLGRSVPTVVYGRRTGPDTFTAVEPVRGEFFRAGDLFGEPRWLPRLRGGAIGAEFVVETILPGQAAAAPAGRTDPNDRTVLATSPQGPRVEAHDPWNGIPVIVTPTMLLLDDEEAHGADPQTVMPVVEGALGRLLRETGEVVHLHTVLPGFGFADPHTDRPVVLSAASVVVHHTAGVPIEGLYAFHQEVHARLTRLDLDPYPRQVLRTALDFGAWVAGLFNAGMAPDLTGFGPAAMVAGHAATMYPMGAVLAGLLAGRPEPPQDGVAWLPQVSLSRLLEGQPVELRLFFEAYAPAILERFRRTAGDAHPRLRGRDWLNEPLPGQDSVTVGSFLEAGLDPIAGEVSPADVFHIRTSRPTLDTNGGRLHTQLLHGNLLGRRDSAGSPGTDRTADRDWLQATVRRLYRRVMTTRSASGNDTQRLPGLYLAGHAAEAARLDVQARAAAALGTPVGQRLSLLQSGAARLLRQLDRDATRLDMRTLDPALTGRPGLTAATAESVQLRLDPDSRAAVRSVDVVGLGLSGTAVRRIRRSFPSAEVHTDGGTEPPLGPARPSDEFPGANSAPLRVSLERVRTRLDDLAGTGGPEALADRIGVYPTWAEEQVQRLRNVAYLAATVFGPSFTESDLVAVRRLLSARLGAPVVTWDDLDELVRDAGGGTPAGPPEHRLAVALALAFAVRERGQDAWTVAGLRALPWPPDERMFPGIGTVPGTVNLHLVLQRLVRLADAHGGAAALALAAGVAAEPSRDAGAVLRDVALLAAVAFGERDFTLEDLSAVERVRGASAAEGRPRPAQWPELVEAVGRLAGDPVWAGTDLPDGTLVRLLLRAVRAAPAGELDLGALRWVPTGAMFAGLGGPGEPFDVARALRQLAEQADAGDGTWTQLLDEVPPRHPASTPDGGPRTPTGDVARERLVAEAVYLATIAFDGDVRLRDWRSMVQLLRAAELDGRPRPRTWADLEDLVRDLRGDDPAARRPVGPALVQVLLHNLFNSGGEQPDRLTLKRLWGLRMPPADRLFRTAAGAPAPIDAAEVMARLGRLRQLDAHPQTRFVQLRITGGQHLQDTAAIAAVLFGSGFTYEQLGTVVYAASLVGGATPGIWDRWKAALDRLRWGAPPGPGPDIVERLRWLVEALGRPGATIDGLDRALSWFDGPQLGVGAELARQRLRTVVGRLTVWAGGQDALAAVAGIDSTLPGLTVDDVVRLALPLFGKDTGLEHLAKVRRMITAAVPAGMPPSLRWSSPQDLGQTWDRWTRVLRDLRFDDPDRPGTVSLEQLRWLVETLGDPTMTLAGLDQEISRYDGPPAGVVAELARLRVRAVADRLTARAGGRTRLTAAAGVDPARPESTVDDVVRLSVRLFGNETGPEHLPTVWRMMTVDLPAGGPPRRRWAELQELVRTVRGRDGDVERQDVLRLYDVVRTAAEGADLRGVPWRPGERMFPGIRTVPHPVSLALVLDRLTGLAGAEGGFDALAAVAGVAVRPPQDAEAALRDVALLTAVVFGTDFSTQDLMAMGKLVRQLPVGPARWPELARLVRQLRGPDDGAATVAEVRLLAVAVRDDPRDILSRDELRALRWRPADGGPPSEPAEDGEWVTRRLVELAAAAGGPAALLDRAGAADERDLRAIASTAAAAFGSSAFTADHLRAVVRVRAAVVAGGGARPDRWPEMVAAARGLLAHDPSWAGPGLSDEALVRLLLRAVDTAPGGDLDLGTLRWVPGGAMFAGVAEPGTTLDVARVVRQLAAQADDTNQAWGTLLRRVMPHRAGFAELEGLAARAVYLATVAFGGELRRRDWEPMARLVRAAEQGGRPRLRTWADLEDLVRDLRGDARSAPRTVDRSHVGALLAAVPPLVRYRRTELTLDALRDLRWPPSEVLFRVADGAPGPVDAAGVMARLRQLDVHPEPLRVRLGLTVEREVRDVAAVAAVVFGSGFTDANLVAVARTASATGGLGPGIWDEWERVLGELLQDGLRPPGPVSVRQLRRLVEALGRPGVTVGGLRRELSRDDGSAVGPVAALARLRVGAVVDRLTVRAGGSALLAGAAGVHPAGPGLGVDDVVRLALRLVGPDVRPEHLATVRRMMTVGLPAGASPRLRWADLEDLVRTVRGSGGDVGDREVRRLYEAVRAAKERQLFRRPLRVRDVRRMWVSPGGEGPARVGPLPLAPADGGTGLRRWLAVDAVADPDSSRRVFDAFAGELLGEDVRRVVDRLAAGRPGDGRLAVARALLALGRQGRVELGYRYLGDGQVGGLLGAGRAELLAVLPGLVRGAGRGDERAVLLEVVAGVAGGTTPGMLGVISARRVMSAAERVGFVRGLAELGRTLPAHRSGLRRVAATLVDCD
ncbi:hypothetical protein ABT369_25785 [Dactylosporangium sp. NPDC000244]|uniref:hypothetical protein n=1 Tax=Dactylosporangium sp. NPDC000244 TaxID=3154365 RepID=UPI00332931C8